MAKTRVLGYRAICAPVETDLLRDSWIWTPESHKSKYRAFKVLQVGHYRLTEKRPAAEIKSGDLVLIDCSMGHVEIPENGIKLRLCSLHDIVAVVKESTHSSC